MRNPHTAGFAIGGTDRFVFMIITRRPRHHEDSCRHMEVRRTRSSARALVGSMCVPALVAVAEPVAGHGRRAAFLRQEIGAPPATVPIIGPREAQPAMQIRFGSGDTMRCTHKLFVIRVIETSG